jgi:membrane protease YdiL (CAAX protease family)
MRRRVAFRLTAGVGVAALLLVLVAPPAPPERLGLIASSWAGVAAGIALYLAVARRRPFVPPGQPAAVAACTVLAVAAAGEEIVWRRVMLGELLRAGAPAALAGSTLGFALVHRARQGLHLVTGAVFGALYLATGALAAPIGAHWAYNTLLLTLAERKERSAGARPEAAG